MPRKAPYVAYTSPLLIRDHVNDDSGSRRRESTRQRDRITTVGVERPHRRVEACGRTPMNGCDRRASFRELTHNVSTNEARAAKNRDPHARTSTVSRLTNVRDFPVPNRHRSAKMNVRTHV